MGVRISSAGRAAGVLPAATAWAGLAIQFAATLDHTGSVAATLSVLTRYFTIVANLVVAVVFTGIVLGRRWAGRPTVLGGATTAILLVGIVYALLLRGLLHLSGEAKLADFVLHDMTPVLVTLYWLVFAPRGGLTMRDPPRWAILPLAYFAYALVRGAATGSYAYPFMNVARMGWSRVLLTALVMAAGFLLAGYAMLWFDRRRARAHP